jgi:hypothetical protein
MSSVCNTPPIRCTDRWFDPQVFLCSSARRPYEYTSGSRLGIHWVSRQVSDSRWVLCADVYICVLVCALILLCADVYICVYLCIQVSVMSLKKMGWQEFMSAPSLNCPLKWYPWLILWAECPWCLMLSHQQFHTGMSLCVLLCTYVYLYTQVPVYSGIFLCTVSVLSCSLLSFCVGWHTPFCVDILYLFERYHAQQATAFPRGVANSSLTSNDGSKLYYIHHLGLQWARSKLCLQRYSIVVHCFVLCIVVFCCVLLCSVVCCCVLSCSIVWCCVLSCTVVYCCVLLCTVYTYMLLCTLICGCVLLFDTLPNTWAWTLQSGKQIQSSQILPVWIHTSKQTWGKMT